MSEITRRRFMKSSLVAAGGVKLGLRLQRRVWSQVRGANEDIRVGIAGIGDKGNSHIDEFRKIPGIRVVALCDPDCLRVEGKAQSMTQPSKDSEGNEISPYATKMEAYIDVREMLDNKDIDAIVIATPNHWHSLIGIWACQAGKDVYVEKPISHNIWEGRQLVKAARKYDRIVQAGTQSRSDVGIKSAIDYIWEGHIGPITLARGFCYKPRKSIGKVDGPQTVPGHIDYDLWCGPAANEPLMRKNLHYDWHWVWKTGNGDIGNQGAHEMDICRWFLKQPSLPQRVMSVGGRFGYIDDGETANTQLALFDYEPAPLLFEVRGLGRKKNDWNMDHYKGVRIGVVIVCEGGYFAGGAGGGWVYDRDGKKIKPFKSSGGGRHPANFIQAIRSRKKEELNAEILVGHVSNSLSHLANISHRLGKPAARKDIVEAFEGNAQVKEAFDRIQEHLLLNQVDLEQTPRMLGPWLEVDNQNERLVGTQAEEANTYLSRKYREPFVVPDVV